MSNAAMLDNLHTPISDIERHTLTGTVANRIEGLPVSGDALAAYAIPEAKARAAAALSTDPTDDYRVTRLRDLPSTPGCPLHGADCEAWA